MAIIHQHLRVSGKQLLLAVVFSFGLISCSAEVGDVPNEAVNDGNTPTTGGTPVAAGPTELKCCTVPNLTNSCF